MRQALIEKARSHVEQPVGAHLLPPHKPRDLVKIVCDQDHGRERDLLALVTRCAPGLLFHSQWLADREVVSEVRRRSNGDDMGADYLVTEMAMLLDWPQLAEVDDRVPQVACHGQRVVLPTRRLISAAHAAERRRKPATITFTAAQRW